jgi:hypothetical protein
MFGLSHSQKGQFSQCEHLSEVGHFEKSCFFVVSLKKVLKSFFLFLIPQPWWDPLTQLGMTNKTLQFQNKNIWNFFLSFSPLFDMVFDSFEQIYILLKVYVISNECVGVGRTWIAMHNIILGLGLTSLSSYLIGGSHFEDSHMCIINLNSQNGGRHYCLCMYHVLFCFYAIFSFHWITIIESIQRFL